MGNSTRVPGHALIAEGEPYYENGRQRFLWRGDGGEGRALCECGELSEALPFGDARKRWHRQHKEEVKARG